MKVKFILEKISEPTNVKMDGQNKNMSVYIEDKSSKV